VRQQVRRSRHEVIESSAFNTLSVIARLLKKKTPSTQVLGVFSVWMRDIGFPQRRAQPNYVN
jgi:hypothetical protein